MLCREQVLADCPLAGISHWGPAPTVRARASVAHQGSGPQSKAEPDRVRVLCLLPAHHHPKQPKLPPQLPLLTKVTESPQETESLKGHQKDPQQPPIPKPNMPLSSSIPHQVPGCDPTAQQAAQLPDRVDHRTGPQIHCDPV